jgi:hypothetical protein
MLVRPRNDFGPGSRETFRFRRHSAPDRRRNFHRLSGERYRVLGIKGPGQARVAKSGRRQGIGRNAPACRPVELSTEKTEAADNPRCESLEFLAAAWCGYTLAQEICGSEYSFW